MQHLIKIGKTQYVAFYDFLNYQWSTIANDSEMFKKKFFDFHSYLLAVNCAPEAERQAVL